MANEPFIGEIRLASFNFAPKGWAMCNGQVLSIVQNQALFAILGTMYGGDGVTTFGLPNLKGRVALGFGQGPGLSNYTQGQSGGEEAHTLTISEMPNHNHSLGVVNADGNLPAPAGNTFASSVARDNNNSTATPDATMNAGVISTAGSSVAHNNLQPYLVVTYMIALQGVFPSRS